MSEQTPRSYVYVATCAALPSCLHKAAIPGNTPWYVTNDELELIVEQNKQFTKTPTHIGTCLSVAKPLCEIMRCYLLSQL